MIPIRPAIHMLNVVLLAVLAYTGVGAFYDTVRRTLPTAAPVRQEAAEQRPAAEQAVRPLSDYTVVSQRNLFGAGAEKKSEAPPAVDIKKLEPTKLKLQLWGTITQPGGRDYAVIESLKDRSQDLYKAGDAVEGAIVKQVLRGKVILTVGDKDEILQMEDVLASAQPDASPGAPPPASAPPQQTRSEQMTISRDDIMGATENIQGLMRQVRIRPHFEKGKPAGLMLSDIQPDSLFTRMGLQSGDVLQEIEGRPIRSMNDILKLYEQLGSSAALALEVKRGGTALNMQYDIE